jgi:exopolysaccharide biosynthesis polyprenyl glycosylphosphotransferase
MRNRSHRKGGFLTKNTNAEQRLWRPATAERRAAAQPLPSLAVPGADRTWVPTEADSISVWEGLRRVPGIPEVARSPVLRSRDALFRRSLALADLIGTTVALLVAVTAIGGARLELQPGALLILPFVVLASKVIGLYDRDQHALRKTTIDELPSILYLALSYTLAIWLAEEALFRPALTRAEVFGLVTATFVLVALGRSLARHCVLAFTPAERCVVIASKADAIRTANKLSSSAGVNARVIGRIPLREADSAQAMAVPTLGGLDSLARIVAEHQIDRAIIAPDSEDQDVTLHTIRWLKALGVKVSVLPRLLEVVGSSSTFDEVEGITLLAVRPYGLSKSSEFLKRSMDIVGAGLGLIVLSPVFAALAVLIKLDSHGPIVFPQVRTGRRGKPFRIYKFRSMVNDAELVKEQLRQRNEALGGLFKITDDPRITRVGRYLRQTSLDELPQLLNVLTGDMSLVGPRPLVPDEDALMEGWERRRVAMKPGMTGLWQIYGSSRIPMNEMVNIDYLYGANWSAWLDLKILLRTIPYVLRRSGR